MYQREDIKGKDNGFSPSFSLSLSFLCQNDGLFSTRFGTFGLKFTACHCKCGANAIEYIHSVSVILHNVSMNFDIRYSSSTDERIREQKSIIKLTLLIITVNACQLLNYNLIEYCQLFPLDRVPRTSTRMYFRLLDY